MKLFFFINFLILTTLFGQEKYLIYFKDKGNIEKEFLAKTIDKEIVAEKYLSKKSIERRKKNCGEDFFSEEDLPISEVYLKFLDENNIEVISKLKWLNSVSAYLTQKDLELLSEQDFIKKIEKVKILKNLPIEEYKSILSKSTFTNSSNHLYDYGFSFTQNELSNIPEVHDMGITGDGVIIGLLDTGFDWKTHNSLKNNKVLAEYDFIYHDKITANDSKDVSFTQHTHGTAVFSIIAGFDEGNIVGPAFNASYLLAKTEFVPTETHIEEDYYAAALEWMDSIGVDITSSSLGYSEFDEPEFSYTYEDMNGKTTVVTRAAEIAFNKGIVVVTSAGNEGNKPWHYITAPGDGFNVLTIGAVTSGNLLASFSSHGPTFDGRIKPEIVAMGSSVFNAIAGSESNYGFGSGTSYSGPISAGIAGLLLSAYPHLTNRQIRSIMMESGDNVDNPNNDVGYGLISALRAVTYPNIEKVDKKFVINKMFPDSVIVNSDEITISFLSPNSDFNPIAILEKDGKGIYSCEIPNLGTDTLITFWYIINSVNGNIRIPEEGVFTWIEGSELITHKIANPIIDNPIPESFVLYQNYPNPFNGTSKILYSVPIVLKNVNVKIKLYDVLGREIKTLVNEFKSSGKYEVDISSNTLASGVYFYRMIADDFIKTKKLVLIK